MISLRDVVTGFGVRDPLAEVWRRSLRGGGGGAAEITGVPPLRYIGDGRPLTDYLVSGNALQDGTPSADAPVDATGCGVRTGNLAPPLTEWVAGFIDANGIIHDPGPTVKEKTSEYIQIAPNTDYAFAFQNGNFPTGELRGWRAVGIYDENKTIISRVGGYELGPLTFNPAADAKFIRLSYRSYGSELNTMLNLGSTALPYEPYGYKLPLTVNGTEHPIFLGEVETTRRVKKLVLTGEESWFEFGAEYPSRFITYAIADRRRGIAPICTHYIGSIVTNYSGLMDGRISVSTTPSSNGRPRTTIRDDRFLTLDDFKSYLAAQYANGTPVTVWYVLAEPETAIVNEPLMKIGDYADTVSFAQAGVAIPTENGENVLDVPTEVPPSEITIKGGISSV